MNAADHPEAFGVFKPVGHVVISFPSLADMEAAVEPIAQAGGLADEDMVRFTPERMVAQADEDIANASPLASIGQELNLVKAHRELAQQGYAFLVVKANGDTAQRVADEARRFNAARAQHYGRFIIEELIEVGDNEHQVGESPDRGLDPQTRSGEEGGDAPPPR